MDLKDYLQMREYSRDEYLNTYNEDIPSIFTRTGILESLLVREDILGRSNLIGFLIKDARRISSREAKVMCLDVHMGICQMSKDGKTVSYYFEGDFSKVDGQYLIHSVGRIVVADLSVKDFFHNGNTPIAELVLIKAKII